MLAGGPHEVHLRSISTNDVSCEREEVYTTSHHYGSIGCG
jgi:hypothetical protein